MKTGEHIKVHLPGESPWAIVTAVLSDDAVMARIDNETVGDLHQYKYGDVATFKSIAGAWELAPLGEQRRNGPQRL